MSSNTTIPMSELFSDEVQMTQREVIVIWSNGKSFPVYLASIKNLFDTEKYLIKLTSDSPSELAQFFLMGFSYVWKVLNIPEESVFSFIAHSDPSNRRIGPGFELSGNREILWGIIDLAGSVQAKKEVIWELDLKIRSQNVDLLSYNGRNYLSVAYSIQRLEFMANTCFLRCMVFSGLAFGRFMKEQKKEHGMDAILNLFESYVHFRSINTAVVDMLFALGYLDDEKEFERVFLERNKSMFI